MSPQPDLPDPAHHDVDSMLSRKFGREVGEFVKAMDLPSPLSNYLKNLLLMLKTFS